MGVKISDDLGACISYVTLKSISPTLIKSMPGGIISTGDEASGWRSVWRFSPIPELS